MLHNLDDLVACGKAPFASRRVKTFAGIVVNPSGVLDADEVKRLVGDKQYRREVMSLVRDQQLVPRKEHLEADDVWEIVDAGATVMLRHLHQYSDSVAAVCRELADATGLPFHASGYLTPPNAQGLPVHSDFDSVYALQLEGMKKWETFGPGATDVADPQMGRLISDEEVAGLEPTFTLFARPSGVVFIPRGTPHRAAAMGSRQSLHVSFGLLHPETDPAIVAKQHPVMPAG